MPPESLVQLLVSRLNEAQRRALEIAISEADARPSPEGLYLVGGGVRDLLLARPQFDLDLALEGDALPLAQRLAEHLGARVTLHRRFGTATLRGAGFALDLARTRSETYLRPGALPTVRPAAIAQDLARRDFTVNAMAIRLSGGDAGRLLDPHDGRRDLERRRLRVLHDASFQDDATRILRGLRYEARLAFRMDRRTLALLRRDLSYLDTISGARLRRELLALCSLQPEANSPLANGPAEAALGRAQALGVLPTIHPTLSWDRRRSSALRRLRDWRFTSDEACLCLLSDTASFQERQGLGERLALRAKTARAVEEFRRLTEENILAQPDLTPSRTAAALSGYSVAALAAVAALSTAPAQGRLLWYLRRGRFVKAALDGHDLMALGVPEGPGLGALLARLREARLDGLVTSRRDEVALVHAALSPEAAGRPPVRADSPSAKAAEDRLKGRPPRRRATVART